MPARASKAPYHQMRVKQRPPPPLYYLLWQCFFLINDHLTPVSYPLAVFLLKQWPPLLTLVWNIKPSPPGKMAAISQTIFSDLCIFVTEDFCILIKISLKFVPKVPIDNDPALV